MKMNEFSITLLIPPQNKKGDIRDLRDDILDNNGVLSIIASLESNGYVVDYINADLLNLTYSQTLEILLYKGQSNVLGLSVLENNIEIACRLVHDLVKNGYRPTFVMGGFFATINYEEIMEYCHELDYCLIGEGEYSFLQLVRSLEHDLPLVDIAGLVRREGNQLIVASPKQIDLDSLPLPTDINMPYLLERGGSAYVITSRGCFSNCSFCSIKAFYKYCEDSPWRKLPINKVVDNIELIVKKWNHRIVPIWDDNFISGKIGKARAYEFWDELERRNIKTNFFMNCRGDDVEKNLFNRLKKVGLYQVGLGIENLVPYHLDLYGKGSNLDKIMRAVDILDELDIRIYMSFIVFNPLTTFNDVRLNLDFFIARLGKEKGSSYRNLLLAPISILGMTVGVKLLQHPLIESIIHKKGFHYHYEIIDKRVNGFKNIMLYISYQWWPLYIKMIELEHYVFNPYFSGFVKSIDAAVISEYNKLWKKLAIINLNVYDAILKFMEGKSNDCIDDVQIFVMEVNHLIKLMQSFIHRNGFDSSFMKIQYYIFEKEGENILYDITKSIFFSISELDKAVIQRYNLYTGEEIIQGLQGDYSLTEIKAALAKINKLRENGIMIYQNSDLETIKENTVVRTVKLMLMKI